MKNTDSVDVQDCQRIQLKSRLRDYWSLLLNEKVRLILNLKSSATYKLVTSPLTLHFTPYHCCLHGSPSNQLVLSNQLFPLVEK